MGERADEDIGGLPWRRILRWLGWGLAAVLILLVVGVLIATLVVDPNRYRGRVEATVTELTGRPFTITGDLHFTWYPWLGITMGPAHLDDAPGTPARGASVTPLAEWRSLAVAAKLVPLFKGEIIVDRLRLDGLHLRLRLDEQGHGNWEGLGPGDGRGSRTASTRAAPLQIAGIEIRDGVVEYAEQSSGLEIRASSWELDMGAWQPGTALPLHSRFLVTTQALPKDGVWVELNAPGILVKTRPLELTETAFTARIAQAQVTTSLHLTHATEMDATTPVRIGGAAKVHVPSVRRLAAELALDNTLPRDPQALGALDLTTSWSYSEGSITARPVALKVDDTTLTGWLNRAAPPASLWSFELHGDRIDLRRYVEVETKVKKPFDAVQILRDLRANGTLTVDEATLADASTRELRLRFETPP